MRVPRIRACPCSKAQSSASHQQPLSRVIHHLRDATVGGGTGAMSASCLTGSVAPRSLPRQSRLRVRGQLVEHVAHQDQRLLGIQGRSLAVGHVRGGVDHADGPHEWR